MGEMLTAGEQQGWRVNVEDLPRREHEPTQELILPFRGVCKNTRAVSPQRSTAMSNEKKESRVKVEDLPQAERELRPEEAKKVQGGIASIRDQTVKSGSGGNFGDTPGLNGGDMIQKM